jgi:hypothetical protein
MKLLVGVLGFAFTAFCIWLTVRLINKRERWAKLVAVPTTALVLFVLGFGPAFWLVDLGLVSERRVAHLYGPSAPAPHPQFRVPEYSSRGGVGAANQRDGSYSSSSNEIAIKSSGLKTSVSKL